MFCCLEIDCAYQLAAVLLGSFKHEVHDSYPVDVYISYAKSIGLAIERRVMDSPPRRPAEFWRICGDEVDTARWRMRHVTGQIRKLASAKADVA